MLKAVFFDAGETIVHSVKIPGLDERSFDEVRKVLLKHGYNVSIDPLPEAYDKAKEIVKKQTPEFIEIDLVERWRVALKLIGVDVDRDVAWECMDAFYKVRQGAGTRVFFDDVIPTVSELRKMGLKLGVISNATYGVSYFLDEPKLSDYFDVVVYSYEVKYRKPHPKIFEIAMNKLGVKPGESMMVGDLLDADIQGAKNIGMIAVWINRGNKEVDMEEVERYKPDYIIRTLIELPKIVAELNKK